MATEDVQLVDAEPSASGAAAAADAPAQATPAAAGAKRPKGSLSARVTKPIAGLVSVITHGGNDRQQAQKSIQRLSATPACMLCASFCIFVTVLVAGLLLLLTSEHFDYEAAVCQVREAHTFTDVDCCEKYKFDEKGGGVCVGAKSKCNLALWKVDYRLSGRSKLQTCVMSLTSTADRVEERLERHNSGIEEECFVLSDLKDTCSAASDAAVATANEHERFTLLASNQDLDNERQVLTWTRPQDHVAGVMLLVFAGFVFFCCIVLPAAVQDVPWCRKFKGELKMAQATELGDGGASPSVEAGSAK